MYRINAMLILLETVETFARLKLLIRNNGFLAFYNEDCTLSTSYICIFFNTSNNILRVLLVHVIYSLLLMFFGYNAEIDAQVDWNQTVNLHICAAVLIYILLLLKQYWTETTKESEQRVDNNTSGKVTIRKRKTAGYHNEQTWQETEHLEKYCSKSSLRKCELPISNSLKWHVNSPTWHWTEWRMSMSTTTTTTTSMLTASKMPTPMVLLYIKIN